MELEERVGYQVLAPKEEQTTYFVVGDLESLSASALYMAGDKGGNFKWNTNKNSLFIPIKGLNIPLHDTYNIDKDGNVSNGHSTINLPKGGKVYMPHSNLIKPTIKSGS